MKCGISCPTVYSFAFCAYHDKWDHISPAFSFFFHYICGFFFYTFLCSFSLLYFSLNYLSSGFKCTISCTGWRGPDFSLFAPELDMTHAILRTRISIEMDYFDSPDFVCAHRIFFSKRVFSWFIFIVCYNLLVTLFINTRLEQVSPSSAFLSKLKCIHTNTHTYAHTHSQTHCSPSCAC